MTGSKIPSHCGRTMSRFTEYHTRVKHLCLECKATTFTQLHKHLGPEGVNKDERLKAKVLEKQARLAQGYRQ